MKQRNKIESSPGYKVLTVVMAYFMMSIGALFAFITFPSPFKWWFWYEPSGIQFFGVFFFSLPAFLLAGIWFRMIRHNTQVSLMPELLCWLSAIVILLMMSATEWVVLVGTAVFIPMPVIIICYFIWDVFFAKRRKI